MEQEKQKLEREGYIGSATYILLCEKIRNMENLII